jgi:hypothetical protein
MWTHRHHHGKVEKAAAEKQHGEALQRMLPVRPPYVAAEDRKGRPRWTGGQVNRSSSELESDSLSALGSLKYTAFETVQGQYVPVGYVPIQLVPK